MRTFIERYIRSVWQLELLLLVKNSAKPISQAELSRSLYLEERVLSPAIEAFHSAGFIRRLADSCLEFAPEDPALAQDIEETAKAYRERRTALINHIYAPPLQHFADAFKFSFERDKE